MRKDAAENKFHKPVEAESKARTRRALMRRAIKKAAGIG